MPTTLSVEVIVAVTSVVDQVVDELAEKVEAGGVVSSKTRSNT